MILTDIFTMRPEYLVYFTSDPSGATRFVGSYYCRSAAEEVVNRIKNHYNHPAWIDTKWEEEVSS